MNTINSPSEKGCNAKIPFFFFLFSLSFTLKDFPSLKYTQPRKGSAEVIA